MIGQVIFIEFMSSLPEHVAVFFTMTIKFLVTLKMLWVLYIIAKHSIDASTSEEVSKYP